MQFKEYESEKDEVVAEEGYLLSIGKAAVEGCSADEIAEMLTLFRNEVGIQVLGYFSDYDLKRKEKCQADGTIMSIASLDVRIATLLHFLLEKTALMTPP